MHSIDVKSCFIGGLLVALLVCVLGAIPVTDTNLHGRFQIAANPSFAFIIDTATGQVWVEQAFWELVSPVMDPENEFRLPKLEIDE